ncbi:MAG: type II toxin-antitoxin system RelE/ParE family toxin [Syntrophobacteraceae bacterium]|nr:type II toxin-antitoxin system RelE/ParE family toxin [Syntrophobacteraceae bacterium]
MPRLIWLPAARDDIARFRRFIEPDNPEAAGRAAARLKKAANLLLTHPGVGKRLEGRQDRELFVPLGKHGYIIRYRLDGEAVVILRVRHAVKDKP